MAEDVAARIDQVLSLTAAQRYDEALAAAEALIAAMPEHFAGWSAKANVLEAKGELPEAILCASRALALEPENVALLFLRAELHMAAGDWEAAIADLDHAEAVDDGFFKNEILLQRATAALQAGDLATAKADCAQLPDDFRALAGNGEAESSKQALLAAIARAERA